MVEVARAKQRQYRPEDLLPRELRLGLGLDDRRADVVAVLGALAAAVEDELAARLDALLDPAEDALLRLPGDDGPDLRLLVGAVADDHRPALLGKALLERLVGLADGHAD